MSRRKSFAAKAIAPQFWHRPEVRSALAQRDIAALLSDFFSQYPDCTQTQLANLIDHDRADISHWLGGKRQACVSDIDVLTRIADGLRMPDAARVILGLAPAQTPMSAFAATADERTGLAGQDTVEVAICGSRSTGTDATAIDAVIAPLARLVLCLGWRVHHGPVGVGIEIMTYMADRYQPPGAEAAIGRYGHHNVVAPAQWVLVIGGGQGTGIEIDFASTMGKRILPFAASGGAAAKFAAEAAADRGLRSWLSDEAFQALLSCTAEEYPAQVQHLTRTATTEGANS